MASTLVRPPFHRGGWVYEEKYDGWRMLVYRSGSQVRLISRRGVTWLTPKLKAEVTFAEIAAGRLRAAVWRGLVTR